MTYREEAAPGFVCRGCGTRRMQDEALYTATGDLVCRACDASGRLARAEVSAPRSVDEDASARPRWAPSRSVLLGAALAFPLVACVVTVARSSLRRDANASVTGALVWSPSEEAFRDVRYVRAMPQPMAGRDAQGAYVVGDGDHAERLDPRATSFAVVAGQPHPDVPPPLERGGPEDPNEDAAPVMAIAGGTFATLSSEGLRFTVHVWRGAAGWKPFATAIGYRSASESCGAALLSTADLVLGCGRDLYVLREGDRNVEAEALELPDHSRLIGVAPARGARVLLVREDGVEVKRSLVEASRGASVVVSEGPLAVTGPRGATSASLPSGELLVTWQGLPRRAWSGAGVGALGGLVTTLVLTAVALTRTNRRAFLLALTVTAFTVVFVGSLLLVMFSLPALG